VVDRGSFFSSWVLEICVVDAGVYFLFLEFGLELIGPFFLGMQC
jgi:hypothetical protein